MRNRQLLARIDRHLDQGDKRWASIDRHLDQADKRWASIDEEIRLTREEVRLTREEVRLSREQRARHAEMFADVRRFTREMMLRMERVTEGHVSATNEVVRAMRDLREESTAQRQALLRMLDRFGPGDSPSAA